MGGIGTTKEGLGGQAFDSAILVGKQSLLGIPV